MSDVEDPAIPVEKSEADVNPAEEAAQPAASDETEGELSGCWLAFR